MLIYKTLKAAVMILHWTGCKFVGQILSVKDGVAFIAGYRM